MFFISVLKRFVFIALVTSFMASAVHAEPQLTAVAAEHKLLQYIENGELKGPSAEIFKLLLQQSQLKAPLEFFPWSRAYQTALQRKNTLILSMVKTEERSKNFHWLIKVSELVRAFISLKNKVNKPIRFISEVKTRTIAVLRNSYSHQSLLKMGFKDNLYEVASIDEGVTLFLAGKVDLIYTDPNVLVNHFTKRNLYADNIISVHILPQTRRESYIAANINTEPFIVEKLKQAAYLLKSTKEYRYYLEYKPLINE